MTKTARRLLLFAAVFLAAVAVAVVFVRRERAPSPVRIVGKTVGPGGVPLADALITLEVAPGDSDEEAAIERVETHSDAKGDFSINFVGHWRHASYLLEAQKTGFETVTVEDAGFLKNPVILRFEPARP
jgi:hypothetical protein